MVLARLLTEVTEVMGVMEVTEVTEVAEVKVIKVTVMVTLNLHSCAFLGVAEHGVDRSCDEEESTQAWRHW